MDIRPTWTDCDEAGDYVVPNVLCPRDLVSRPDNMDETVPHTHTHRCRAAYSSDRREGVRILSASASSPVLLHSIF